MSLPKHSAPYSLNVTYTVLIFHIRALWLSILSARVPCPNVKNKNGRLDQYDPEHFEV